MSDIWQIIRNKYKDQYILPNNKFVNILPTIYDIGKINSFKTTPDQGILPGGEGKLENMVTVVNTCINKDCNK